MSIFSFYGGGFATIPAYIADVFGTKYVGGRYTPAENRLCWPKYSPAGGIHGRMLTAWSAAGLVGPQVPQDKARADRGVVVAARREAYEAADLCAGALLVGFNMGLSDSSYDWAAALDAARRRRATVVFFAPTRLELSRDARALKKAGAVLVSDALWNPWHSPSWKQSGELANDVYRKHSWARCAVFK